MTITIMTLMTGHVTKMMKEYGMSRNDREDKTQPTDKDDDVGCDSDDGIGQEHKHKRDDQDSEDEDDENACKIVTKMMILKHQIDMMM